MCGVFGIIKERRRKPDMGTLRALTLANRERGKESLGYFDSTSAMLKKGDDPLDVLASDDCTAWMDRAEQEAWFIVGHTRYSTRGKVCDQNSHPFEYGEVIGAHNGIIDAPHSYAVDSEYAIDLLNKHKSNYQTALEGQYGYWTLAWYDKRLDELFVSMHDNTCGLVKYRGAWYFSSDPDHLATVVGSREMIVLQNGGTVSFDSEGRIKWREPFKSKISHKYKKDSRTGGRSGYNSGYYDGNSSWSSSTSTKKSGSGTVGNTGSGATLTVTDSEGTIKDYDEEFRRIWAEYESQYES